MNITFRHLVSEDWKRASEIYAEGIATGNATFEQIIPTWEEWDKSHLKTCRIIAELAGELAGWACLSPVSDRCVYGGVAEASVYIKKVHRGKGVGTELLNKLIEESEQEGFWTLQAGVFSENTASLKLIEKLGFRQIGYREKVGKMNGVWRNTILLERRSKKTGID